MLTNQFLGTANGFNAANPTAVTSANRIDADLKAPVTQTVVAGLDRELRANLAVSVNYTYTRTTNLLGNATFSVTPRVGVSLSDYAAGPTLTGTLPDGSSYSVPTFIANQAKVTAGGSGFLLTNWNGYYTDYHGVEVSAVKRLSNRWMGRVGVSLNNAREHYAPEAMYDTNGNPTRTITEPLVDGGQFAPQSSGNSAGNVYINARWQFNANGMYQAPFGIDVAGERVRPPGLSVPAVPHAGARRRHRALGAGHAGDRHLPLRQRVGHRPAGGADVQAARGQPARDGRRVQRHQRATRC